MYLGYLVLCAILFQGIASLSHNRTTDSLDVHVRMKRVVDKTTDGHRRLTLRDVGYVVDVMANGIHVCAGTILSPNVILTVANCVLDFVRYTVRAGTVSRKGGSIHLVNGIISHPNFGLDEFENNIALLSILEPIILAPDFNSRIHIYDLSHGHLPPNTIVTTSGWGMAIKYNSASVGLFSRGGGKIETPNELRSIDLPTINLVQCRNHHNFNAEINLDKLLCIYHEKKYSAAGDDGNPLVYDGYLIGILTLYGHNHRPDVFLNLAHPDYKNWILTHMHNIPVYPHVHQQQEQFNNPHIRPRASSSTGKVHPGHQ